jgi:hypothetical protein
LAKLFFFFLHRGGAEFPSRLLGRSFVFFIGQFGSSSWGILRFHHILHFVIRLYQVFAAFGKQASERASELYVAQQRPWAEAFPKLMGHPHSPALSAQYFGNAQALGHYPIL